jgi:hypothetical protein
MSAARVAMRELFIYRGSSNITEDVFTTMQDHLAQYCDDIRTNTNYITSHQQSFDKEFLSLLHGDNVRI